MFPVFNKTSFGERLYLLSLPCIQFVCNVHVQVALINHVSIRQDSISLQQEDSIESPSVAAGALAALALIGGVDERPRLGGLVRHEEHGHGTVARIMPNGKVTVQFHGNSPRNHDNMYPNNQETSQARIVRLSELIHVSVSLLPRTSLFLDFFFSQSCI